MPQSTDKNPADPGTFRQAGKGTYSPSGFEATGTHHGSKLKYKFSLSGKRGTKR